MKFREEEVDNFLNAFKSVEHHIRNFNGCKGLQLLQQTDDPLPFSLIACGIQKKAYITTVFSELFKNTWAKTRILFADKPEAWSLSEVIQQL